MIVCTLPIPQVVRRGWEDHETFHLYVPWWFEAFSDKELSIHHRKKYISNKKDVAMESVLHQVHQSGPDRSQDSVRAPMSIASQWCSRQSNSWDTLSRRYEHVDMAFQHPTVWSCLWCSPHTLGPRSGTSKRWRSRMRTNPKSDDRSMSV